MLVFWLFNAFFKLYCQIVFQHILVLYRVCLTLMFICELYSQRFILSLVATVLINDAKEKKRKLAQSAVLLQFKQ